MELKNPIPGHRAEKEENGFPEDFLFGSASAAYQVEGAYKEDGKGDSIWDNWVRMDGKTYQGTNGDVAADHYHRFREDVRLMKEMGLKAYRFSVSWARILPEGRGRIEKKGLDFYHQLIDELLEHDIEPVLTIYHWELPQTLQDEYGGWESRRIIDDFTEYAKVLFEAFGKKVKYWIVLNEPNIFTQLGYLLALHLDEQSVITATGNTQTQVRHAFSHAFGLEFLPNDDVPVATIRHGKQHPEFRPPALVHLHQAHQGYLFFVFCHLTPTQNGNTSRLSSSAKRASKS
ncbi:MAG: glycoside hydrolase family 1 protein [Clostridia bacterium]|nr:glycoside hydrolase family 1 protein [Clostridia bacterium]